MHCLVFSIQIIPNTNGVVYSSLSFSLNDILDLWSCLDTCRECVYTPSMRFITVANFLPSTEEIALFLAHSLLILFFSYCANYRHHGPLFILHLYPQHLGFKFRSLSHLNCSANQVKSQSSEQLQGRLPTSHPGAVIEIKVNYSHSAH